MKPNADRPNDASGSRAGRPSGSRRRGNSDEGEAAADERIDPTAWRAYGLSLWALVPGLGLLLGPAALVLACVSLRGASNHTGSRARAKVAALLAGLVTLTQWLGLVLMVRGWGK